MTLASSDLPRLLTFCDGLIVMHLTEDFVTITSFVEHVKLIYIHVLNAEMTVEHTSKWPSPSEMDDGAERALIRTPGASSQYQST